MYKMTLDMLKKVLIIEVQGFFKPEEAKKFLVDYHAKTNAINPKEYSLVVSGENFKTISQETVPLLDLCMKLYKETGFKRYLGTKPKSAVATVQLRKIIKANNMDWPMPDTVEDALRLIEA